MQNEQQGRSPVVNILIAEANEMNCQLVESALRPRRHGVSVVASTVGAREALALLKERAPDVAVISARLQEGPFEGYRVLGELRSLQSKTRAIMGWQSRSLCHEQHTVATLFQGVHEQTVQKAFIELQIRFCRSAGSVATSP